LAEGKIQPRLQSAVAQNQTERTLLHSAGDRGPVVGRLRLESRLHWTPARPSLTVRWTVKIGLKRKLLE